MKILTDRRRAAAVHQGGAVLARRARSATPRSSCTPASTTTRSCPTSSSTSSRCRGPTTTSASAPARTAARPAQILERVEDVMRQEAPDAVVDLRRHEQHARRRAGRRQARHPDRARRGRPAQLRARHAGGDQPHRRRPRLDLALRPHQTRRRKPAPRRLHVARRASTIARNPPPT